MKKQSYHVIENYILDSIDSSGYDDLPRPFVEDKLRFLKETFYSEYGWHIKQVGELEALRQWLMGLPSSCNIEWRNNEILLLGQQWGFLAEKYTRNQEYDWLDRWFMMIAMRIKGLWDKHDINSTLKEGA